MANLLANPITGSRDVRKVYAVLRGEGAAAGLNFSTITVLRGGSWNRGELAVFPAPSDAALSANGVQVSGGFTAQIAFPIEGSSTAFYALPVTARDQVFSLELVSVLTNPDGSTIEISNIRKAVCKAASRRNFTVTLQFLSVDTSALRALYPSRRFDVAAWPDLYADHLNRPVPVVIGTGIKVPLAWVKKPGGGHTKYSFAGPEKLGAATQSWLSVYRRGRLVNPAEYAVTSYTQGGYTVFDIDFDREPKDGSGGLYEMTADVNGSLSRNVVDEIQRLLQVAGITVDAATFAAASAYAAANGMIVDCCYSRPRTLISIIQQLLVVARAFLRETATGAWAIVQDTPKAVALTLNEKSDLIEISGEDFIEVPSEITIEYRPKDDNENYSRRLTRTVGGTGDPVVIRNQYVRDNDTADRMLCFYALRAAKNRRATVRVRAAQFENGEVVTISSASAWLGSTTWIIEKVERPVDENVLSLREYDAGVYVYTPGTLPADYTNDYVPDYSQTPPGQPGAPVIVSQATSINTDGTVQAYALVRATPPSVNWSKLYALATNIATKEVYLVELKLNAGNYEGTLTGMRPGESHTLVAFANNGTLDGATSTLVGGFLSSENVSPPVAPSSVAAAQITGAQVQVTWAAATGRNIANYEVQRKVGLGAFAAFSPARFVNGVATIDNGLIFGNQVQYRVRTIDRSNNVSAWVSSNTVTVTANITDSSVVSGGISGVSISNLAINQSRTQTGTGSVSTGSILPQDFANVFLPDFSYATAIEANGSIVKNLLVCCANNLVKPGSLPVTAASFGIFNNEPIGGSSLGAGISYRSTSA